uniref:Uncharacterized protein n=1 Tax=Glossina palpalis gambiensis TaxID=67801 RepID=A0A1B0BI24_9MUSC
MQWMSNNKKTNRDKPKFLKFYVLVFVCIENYALVHAIYYYYNNAVQKLLLLYVRYSQHYSRHIKMI